MIVKIHKDGGKTVRIEGKSANRTPEEVIEAHGFDPDTTEWSIKKSPEEQISELEARLSDLE